MEPISIIVAVDQLGGFGKDGEIPWNFPEDMKHFKETTANSICVMGRRTYEDMLEITKKRYKQRVSNKNKKAIAEYEANDKLGKKPQEETVEPIVDILPNRTSYVITSNKEYDAPGATVMSSLRDVIYALDQNEKREIFVIGGQQMFIESLPWVSTVHMTIIKGEYDCDVFFPINILDTKFKIVDGTQNDDMYFVKYKRTVR